MPKIVILLIFLLCFHNAFIICTFCQNLPIDDINEVDSTNPRIISPIPVNTQNSRDSNNPLDQITSGLPNVPSNSRLIVGTFQGLVAM